MLITEKQQRTLSKIVRRSGRTFSTLAKECGLKNVPDNIEKLTEAQAGDLIRSCGMFLMEDLKPKQ